MLTLRFCTNTRQLGSAAFTTTHPTYLGRILLIFRLVLLLDALFVVRSDPRSRGLWSFLLDTFGFLGTRLSLGRSGAGTFGWGFFGFARGSSIVGRGAFVAYVSHGPDFGDAVDDGFGGAVCRGDQLYVLFLGFAARRGWMVLEGM